MKTFGEDFATDVKINKMKLEEECEVQPSMRYYYQEQLAQARNEEREAKDALSRTLASKELFFRRTPPDGLKITESVISALVEDSTEVLEAKEDLRKASKAVDLMYAITASLDDRKSELDNLVRLSISSYYSQADSRDKLNGRG